MKKLLMTTIVMAILAFPSFAQYAYQLQLQKTKLQGNVSKVIEGKLKYYEEWGEMKVKMDTVRISFYDKDGRRLVSFGSHNIVRKYSYQNGRISRIDYYRNGWEIGKINTTFPLFQNSECSDIYEYRDDGKLASITMTCPIDEDGILQTSIRESMYDEGYPDCIYDYEDRLNNSWRSAHLSKIIYKYNSDGTYEVIGCDYQGKTVFKNAVKEKGTLVGNSWGVCIYDNDGRLQVFGDEWNADNGSVKYAIYLGYNKKGDLAIKSTREVGIKEIEIAPWLSATYSYSGDTVFEYEYDKNGNWIRRTEFETRADGKRKNELHFGRIIEYGNYIDLDALQKAKLDEFEAAKRAEDEYVKSRFAQLIPVRFEGLEMETIVETYLLYEKCKQEYANNSESWSKSERKKKYQEIQALGSKIFSLAGIRETDTGMWYLLLAYIWEDFLVSEDGVASNYWVALDALDAAEKNGNRDYNLMIKCQYMMPSSKELAKAGLRDGQAYIAHCSQIETPTKVRFKDPDYINRIQQLEESFRIEYRDL